MIKLADEPANGSSKTDNSAKNWSWKIRRLKVFDKMSLIKAQSTTKNKIQIV
ncbi:hypothetical protein HYE41_03825 [Mycoplasmopsis bovis]|nr:hypothetical protein [Mycoplasmopsis bovis]QQH20753.1 hypothetical protein HYE41_03825 [Mycoplasmopsis bovis]